MAEETVVDTEEIQTLDDLLDQDFHMDDEGEIIMPTAKPDADATPAAAPTEGPATEPVPASGEPTHDWEKRYGDLLPEFTRRSQDLAELKTANAELEKQNAELREGDSDPDGNAKPVDVPENLIGALQDPAQGAQLIMDLADKVVEKRMGEFVTRVAPMLDDYEIETELRDVALSPGNEDFFELLPQIRQIIARSEHDIGFEDALRIARTFRGVGEGTSGEPAKGENKVPEPAPKVSAEEVAKQAARHEPETTVAGEVQEPPKKVETVDDAFNAAFDEHYG